MGGGGGGGSGCVVSVDHTSLGTPNTPPLPPHSASPVLSFFLLPHASCAPTPRQQGAEAGTAVIRLFNRSYRRISPTSPIIRLTAAQRKCAGRGVDTVFVVDIGRDDVAHNRLSFHTATVPSNGGVWVADPASLLRCLGVVWTHPPQINWPRAAVWWLCRQLAKSRSKKARRSYACFFHVSIVQRHPMKACSLDEWCGRGSTFLSLSAFSRETSDSSSCVFVRVFALWCWVVVPAVGGSCRKI
jgi:hypothetical protein